MTQLHPVDVQRPQTLLDNFEDSTGAAYLLGKSRSTVSDMADRGLIMRYRVGTAVLYFRPEVQEVAEALRRLRIKAGAHPMDPCASGCASPAAHAEGAHDV